MQNDISTITTYESGVMQSTAHRVLGRINSKYLEQYGLTSMQWFTIGFVYDKGKNGVRLSELMRLLDTTMPYITNMINQLESKGILVKVSDTKDSRVKIVRVSDSYRPKVAEIESGLRDELRKQLYRADHISREELSTYITVLYKIAQSQKNTD